MFPCVGVMGENKTCFVRPPNNWSFAGGVVWEENLPWSGSDIVPLVTLSYANLTPQMYT